MMESSETLREVMADVVKEEEEIESRSVESEAAEEMEESSSSLCVPRLVAIECGGLGGGDGAGERVGEGMTPSRGEEATSSISSGSIGAAGSSFEITLRAHTVSKACDTRRKDEPRQARIILHRRIPQRAFQRPLRVSQLAHARLRHPALPR